ncbi:hypothetical protein Sjap_020612 [Stephania japonica]|uniref:Uncharacterized protein n=1 Tax=Stephania japonica TaxID=461633 RepID=A0AAP0F8D0_9MAGN
MNYVLKVKGNIELLEVLKRKGNCSRIYDSRSQFSLQPVVSLVLKKLSDNPLRCVISDRIYNPYVCHVHQIVDPQISDPNSSPSDPNPVEAIVTVVVSVPPGTGETTSILALAHQLLGKNYEKAVLELDASDERGNDFVRERIKKFAENEVLLPPELHKIVILDKANRLSDEEILNRLVVILQAEKVPYMPEGLEPISVGANGDMRQAINNLQATCNRYGLPNQENAHGLQVSTTLRTLTTAFVGILCGAFSILGKHSLWYEATFMIGSAICGVMYAAKRSSDAIGAKQMNPPSPLVKLTLECSWQWDLWLEGLQF